MRTALFVAIAALVCLPGAAIAQPQRAPVKTAFVDGPPAPIPPAVVSRDAAGHVPLRATRLPVRRAPDGRLADRRRRRVITDAEFQAKKAKLLDRL